MAESGTIRWEDVPKSARKSLFRVWVDARELLWAENCWSFFSQNGLTTYSDQVTKCRVLIRLLTLAEIYREFCDLVWEERYECELQVWASEIELNRFRVAQCVGRDFEQGSDEDEDVLFGSALLTLAEDARSEVYSALKVHFGSDAEIFVSLWNTVPFRDREDEPGSKREYETQEQFDGVEDETVSGGLELEQNGKVACDIDWFENAEEILNIVTLEKVSAYAWIEDGMPRVR